MEEEDFLNRIMKEFKKIKADDRYNQKQKNYKYANLMNLIEQQFNISALVEAEFDKLDDDIKELYREISYERKFEVYE